MHFAHLRVVGRSSSCGPFVQHSILTIRAPSHAYGGWGQCTWKIHRVLGRGLFEGSGVTPSALRSRGSQSTDCPFRKPFQPIYRPFALHSWCSHAWTLRIREVRIQGLYKEPRRCNRIWYMDMASILWFSWSLRWYGPLTWNHS